MSEIVVSKDTVLTPKQIMKREANKAFKLTHPDYETEYYEAHKEELREKSRVYRLENMQHIVQYRKDNEVKNNAYAAKYYKDNLDRLMTSHQCECGGRYTVKHRARHERTDIHIRSLEIA